VTLPIIINYSQPGLQVLVNLTSTYFNFINLPYYAIIDNYNNYVYAWIESLGYNNSNGFYYVNLWLKLTNATSYYFVYNGSYNQYMGINPILDNLFNLHYGQYDNGINVFNNYWNFAGSNLPNGLTALGNVTVNNGITLSSCASFSSIIYTNYTINSNNNILESYMNQSFYGGLFYSISFTGQPYTDTSIWINNGT
ncbi:MAG: hypothetical protein ACP5L0_07820, partial [Caldisphaera sp.]|uniref:hypothetical protein n=1 Tax=Caldisphaera sp. TaxID=2060322 RepID=UPI003D0D3F40